MPDNKNAAITNLRKPEYPLDPLFINRWSPRAMSGEEMSEKELFTLFEAAKWAPSSSNSQPWRIIYARRNTPHWEKFLSLLVPGNRAWAENAAALLVMVSKKTFEHNGKFSRTHSYDTGAAWENLALQGSINSWVIHGMAGFDYEKAKSALNIPDDYEVEAMAAVGKPGPKENLPAALQEREFPSDRKQLEAFAFEGQFKV